MTRSPVHLFSRDRVATGARTAALVACGAFALAATATVAAPASAVEDSLTCDGKDVTIVAGPFAHGSSVYGTAGNDVIMALGGGHLIYGQGGNDSICAVSDDGSTGDGISGGTGDDYISAGGGND